MKKEDGTLLEVTNEFKDDPEVIQIMKEMNLLEERLFKIVMKKKFGVDAGFLPNDEDHIVIDGVIMNNEEFVEWLIDNGAIESDEEVGQA